MTGRIVAGYRLARKVGEGGMGSVYEAIHQGIGRRAAVKLLSPELAREPEIIDRFFNEARAVNIVRHPDIVNISDLGQMPDGTAYLVMEYLEGESLSLRLHRVGKLPLPEALRLSRQIASALHAVHEQGVVHRDLKPDNVMIIADPESHAGERAKLLDFGIAKLAEEHQRLGPRQVKTRVGMVLGTPVYMSPEQCRGADQVDAKADVYSLGVMVYQMLSGHPPFVAEGEGELMAAHIYEEPVPLCDVLPGVPLPLSDLVHQMLDKDRALRPTMAQVVNRLEEAGAPRTTGNISLVMPPATPRLPRAAEELAFAVTGAKVLEQAGRRRFWLPVSAAACSLALAGVAILAWVSFHRATASRQPVPVPPAQVKQAPRHVPVPVPNVAVPVGPRVHWSVITEPDGAEIVRVADGAVLALTPFVTERPAEIGLLTVALRRRGFVEKRIDLDLSANLMIHESLSAEGVRQKHGPRLHAAVTPEVRPNRPDPSDKGHAQDPATMVTPPLPPNYQIEDFERPLMRQKAGDGPSR